MRVAEVFKNGIFAGKLIENEQLNFVFQYDKLYLQDPHKSAISITLPKSKIEFESEKLFPFFSNMLAEGTNLGIQSRYLKIDENDKFSLLCATAHSDSIGAVTLKLLENNSFSNV